MIKVYVLDCSIEEIDGKIINEITDQEFILLGKSFTLLEFQFWLNDPEMSPLMMSVDIQISNCWFRFIEHGKD